LIQTMNLTGITTVDPINLIVRVLTGTTVNALDVYLTANNWALPTGTVIDDLTVGGSVIPGCHGTGKSEGLVADRVRQIRIVDAFGVLRTYTGEQLNYAVVSLGLLGVVYDMDIQASVAQNIHVLAQPAPYNTTITAASLMALFNANAGLEMYLPALSPTIQVRTTNPSTAPSDFNFDAYIAAGAATVAAGLEFAPIFEEYPAVLSEVDNDSGFSIFANQNSTWPEWAAVHYGPGIQGGPKMFNPELVIPVNNNLAGWQTAADALNYLNAQQFFFYNTYGQAPVTFGLNARYTGSTDMAASPCNVDADVCMWIDILLGENAAGTTDFMNTIYPVLTSAPFHGEYHWAKTWSQVPPSQSAKLAGLIAFRDFMNVDPTGIFWNEALLRVAVQEFAPVI